jgi:periplasmic divalent cation tolerance protein
LKLNQYILVLTTVPDVEVGQIIAERLIADRLAACVTLSAASQSVYWWQGKVSQEPEHILFIKTQRAHYPRLEEKILQIHPYEMPEIIALPILTGNKKYLKWIDSEVRSKT